MEIRKRFYDILNVETDEGENFDMHSRHGSYLEIEHSYPGSMHEGFRVSIDATISLTREEAGILAQVLDIWSKTGKLEIPSQDRPSVATTGTEGNDTA